MSNITNLINEFNNQNISLFFENKITSFKPEKEIFINTVNKETPYSDPVKIGYAELKNHEELLVFTCEYNKKLTERSAKKQQFEIAKKVLKEDFKDGAIFIFYDAQGNFRFSFIRRNYGEKGNKKYSTWKRYTYYVSPSETNKTFKERIDKCSYNNLDSIQEAFSVEKLTKEFYNELFAWYQWAISDEVGITFPNDTNTSEDDRIKLEEQIIRLITRLLFVWFIKQKKLVPNTLFDTDKLSKILKDFNGNDKINGNYYNAILQNLFFATLNKEVNEREFAKLKSRDIKTRYRYEKMFNLSQNQIIELFKPIPFLNGGLFECLDKEDINSVKYFLDGFSRNPTKAANGNFRHRAFIPNAVFFDEDKGIIPLLKRYNFTVEENAPNEVQVALDPELLGKVFENLLGAFNPETKETARKQSGSFYTPREIVEYMVTESLATYLTNHLPKISKTTIQQLLQEEELPTELKENYALCKQISNTLRKIKILDPACGSGAFPMGILNKLVHTLEKLDHKKEENIHNLKLHLIEECIYGIDIQTIAVQISKLRFFISLVVEQDAMDISKPENNYNVLTLPNLETKFVAANTLIGIQRKKAGDFVGTLFTDPQIETTKQQLIKIRKQHYYAKTVGAKKRLREQDAILRNKLTKLLQDNNDYAPEDAKQFSQWNPYDQNATSPFFDTEWMFGLQEGFDVVIGNPPYIKEYVFKSAFDGFRNSKYYKGKMDLWHGFTCVGIDFLNKNGILTFIAQNNWVTNFGAEKMRDKIINDTKIINITDFNHYMIFESADIQTSVMIFQKDNKTEIYDFDFRKLNQTNTKYNDVLDIIKSKKKNNILYRPNFKRSSYVGKYLLFNEEYIENILFKILKNGNFYLNESEVANGIHSHHDSISKKMTSKIEKSKVGDGIFVLNEEEVSNLKLNKNEWELLKPFYDSKCLKRYFGNKNFMPKKYVIYTDSSFKNISQMISYPNLKNHLDRYVEVITSDNKPYGLHRSREEDFFKGEKIISLRKCSDRPTFTFTDFECYVSATFYVIKTERINQKYLTALLNSNLYRFWFEYKGKMQGTNYQIDKQPLMDVPILKTDLKFQERLIKILDNILSFKNDGLETSDLENQLDIMVYKLYHLNYQEVLVIDPAFNLTQEAYNNYKIA